LAEAAWEEEIEDAARGILVGEVCGEGDGDGKKALYVYHSR